MDNAANGAIFRSKTCQNEMQVTICRFMVQVPLGHGGITHMEAGMAESDKLLRGEVNNSRGVSRPKLNDDFPKSVDCRYNSRLWHRHCASVVESRTYQVASNSA
ncbi:hypothetical protein JBO49_13720 [Serratia fonticola]|uniref:hypothetical protein n=1 Tax=Serratia TaxID=613 RepID=UPI000EF46377|nr:MULTISPECIES: hypothetical protein [Serratia]AYM92271.1 hypothetical protein D9980_17730 [Serratia sp. 3ACOL1]MBL5861674.1 hypothetical protein [Serratia fonticola]